MKRYLYYSLRIINGEYHYSSKGVTYFDNPKESIDKWLKDYAKTFYGGKAYKDGDYYMFYGGEVAVKVESSREITENEYNVLREFI